MRAFARRWTLAIRAALYGCPDCAPPKLDRAELASPTEIKLVFDRNLKIEKWDGTPGYKAAGFRFRNGDMSLGDGNIVTTSVNGNSVVVTIDRPVSPGTRMDYGSGNDGQGQPALRDAENRLPVRMVFGHELRQP